MGIQTFNRERLEQMGRLGFGDARTFGEVVRLGHDRGFTVSGDLLFNLPAQPLDAMKGDVRRAIDIGLDHLGLYHLVMFAGLGTPWSKDPALVGTLPSNEEAAGNWLELRGLLLGYGFDQKTLTNFERPEFLGDDRRFVYEELSFRPDRYDMIGFGPSGISFVDSGGVAVKVINPEGAAAYQSAVDRDRPAWDRAFEYDFEELEVLHLIRRLAALHIERADYEASFGGDPLDDFPGEFEALEQEGLVIVTDESIEPTPRGIFYADSIAALLSSKAIQARRNGPNDGIFRENSNGRGHM
jgi:oxygen-independent coproporphyrinogen-3 oxidase